MRKWIVLFLLFLGGVTLGAQGSLSEQVLRLLTRDNTWSGVNTYARTVGIELERATAPLVDPTDRLENRGGNLYFNDVLVAPSGGAGTVTSVAMTVPSFLSVAGSPILTTGTFAVTLATQTANTVFAGPTGGGAATPAFRALVAADIPSLSATYATASNAMAFTNKTGNISQWTNDSGYITSAGTGSTSIVTLGTVTTGTWNATLVAGQYGGTGVANTGKTITLGGNFTTSGANNLTFTTSGATSITLPTSGTMVTSTVTTLSSLVSIGTITTGVWTGTAIAAANGGTGQTTYTIGDLLQASASTTLSKLAAVATGNVLISGGVGTVSSWGKVGLTTHVSGILPVANGGTALSTTPTNGQLFIGNGTNYTLATLTGTASQITVTNGVGTITLSLPQSIATTSDPQFAHLGLGTGTDGSSAITTTKQINIGINAIGNCGASTTVDFANGQVQSTTLNAAVCVLTFNNPTTGAMSYELVITQDGVGGRLITWPAAVLWEGGVAPTLSTNPGDIDYCSLKYTGTNYLGSCKLGF